MARIPPAVRPPTETDLIAAAESFDLELTEEELDAIAAAVDDLLPTYQRLRDLDAGGPSRDLSGRTVSGPPTPEEDPHNAVVRRCSVPGAAHGPLAGYSIGLKDCIPVAGVEMTCGSNLLEGYVPGRDATVVERLLDAGGTITATLNLEDLAFSGSGELSAHGPVLNPRDPDHLSGGSSSGSAAAVLEGTVDVSLGTDQGGSSRIPASWCGVVGYKPTFGLVPYTGLMSRDPSIDHVGVFSRTVDDCARVLEAIGGPDPGDPRQAEFDPEAYVDGLGRDPADVSVGIVEEGFGREEADPDVDAAVRSALDAFAEEGATVEAVSVPMHLDGPAILTGIVTEGSAAMVRAENVGRFARGRYDVGWAGAFGRARRTNARDFPPKQKLALAFGGYLAERYNGRFYAKAHNLVPDLAGAYDGALDGVDVLAMPTTPYTAYAVDPDISLGAAMRRATAMNGNTSPFDASGHPAVSVPCGAVDGLPVGLMFVGGRFEDASVLAAADAFERHVFDWESF